GSHGVVKPCRSGRVHQLHAALGTALARQKGVIAAADDINNGVADTDDVVLLHACLRPHGRAEGIRASISTRSTTPKPAWRARRRRFCVCGPPEPAHLSPNSAIASIRAWPGRPAKIG